MGSELEDGGMYLEWGSELEDEEMYLEWGV